MAARKPSPTPQIIEGEVLGRSTPEESPVAPRNENSDQEFRDQIQQQATTNMILERQVSVLRENLAQKSNQCIDHEVTISLLNQQIQMMQQAQQPAANFQPSGTVQ